MKKRYIDCVRYPAEDTRAKHAAGDVIKEAKLTHANCADLNNSIRMNLKIIQEQEDLNLAGLD